MRGGVNKRKRDACRTHNNRGRDKKEKRVKEEAVGTKGGE